MENILIFSILFFASLYVICSLMIYAYLDRKGENTNLLLIRLFIFSYVSKYKRMTRAETGKVGVLYYFWIITINLALLSTIILLMLKLN